MTNRLERLEQRRKNLGEKITSDLSWRKFSTKLLKNLNSHIDFETLQFIYEIGWCGGEDDSLRKLKELLKRQQLNEIADLNNTCRLGEDELGIIPVGSYLKTYLWKFNSGQSFVQVVKGSFDDSHEEIKYKTEIKSLDTGLIKNRKLIYPI